jgi:hypothetical protein
MVDYRSTMLFFYVQDVAGDGNCLFHSLLQAFPRTPYKIPEQVRNEIVTFVKGGKINGKGVVEKEYIGLLKEAV